MVEETRKNSKKSSEKSSIFKIISDLENERADEQ